MKSLFAVLALGFVLGMRHATDADHVVAVTTVVSQQRSVRSAGIIGAVWGIGHTVTIFLIGGAIILFSVTIPPRLGLGMEFSVALMLILLGSVNLWSARGADASASHHYDGWAACEILRPMPLARSLAIGVVHGLAGSAAAALLVLATIRDPRWAMLYLALFGGGTIVGMLLITSAVALPFALAADRFGRLNRQMMRIASVVSIAFGIFLAYKGWRLRWPVLIGAALDAGVSRRVLSRASSQ